MESVERVETTGLFITQYDYADFSISIKELVKSASLAQLDAAVATMAGKLNHDLYGGIIDSNEEIIDFMLHQELKIILPEGSPYENDLISENDVKAALKKWHFKSVDSLIQPHVRRRRKLFSPWRIYKITFTVGS